MWAIKNPATGLLKTRPVHGAPALGGRDLLQARNSVQEEDAAVDQHAAAARGRTAGTSGQCSRGRGCTRGSASHASCSTAFLLRCARRLRARPQRSG